MIKALIHLDNLNHNLQLIRSGLPEGCLLCPAVKANGYGHGALRISRFLKQQGVSHLGVARVDEGGELRDGGIEGPIVLFGPGAPEEIPQILKYGLSPMAGSKEYLLALQKEAQQQKCSVEIHLKVDTGMGRFGCTPLEVPELARMIQNSPQLILKGLSTHFPVSDTPNQDDRDFTRQQWQTLSELAENLKREGIDPGLIHMANSGAIISHRQLWQQPLPSPQQMVRPGIMLYGYAPDRSLKNYLDLKPVMELQSRVSFIKKIAPGTTLSYGRTWKAPEERYIATVSAGYGDGYSRGLSNRGNLWIKGRLYPIVGRVCMDQLMVDLGTETEVDIQDPVILFGPQQGAPDGWDIAEMLGTIPYEVTCNIAQRVSRVFIEP